MIFTSLDHNQVNSCHHLFKFLRKLKIIGLIETQVVGAPPTMTSRYILTIEKYHPGVYKTGMEIAMERLDELGFAFDGPDEDNQAVS